MPAPFTDWSSEDSCDRTNWEEREKISKVQRREQRQLAEKERKRREEQNTASSKSNAPGPSCKEDISIPAPEEKQKVRKLDLLKLWNPPIREITSSHPEPLTTNTPTMASIMATADMPSPAKTCKRWGLPCPFCAQSAPHPSPVDSDWSEEDWDRNIEREKRKVKQRKEEEMKQRQEREEQEKIKSDPNYYLPNPIYVPSYEEEPPALVRNLVTDPAPEKPQTLKKAKRRTWQKRKEE